MHGLLKSVLVTLGQIEVRGKENLDMLLGCIQVLEKLLAASEEKTETRTEKAEVMVDGDPDEPRT